MKKITAIIISVSLMLSGVSAFANGDDDFAERVKEMQKLGIIAADNDLRLDDVITRAEATKLICSACGFDNDMSETPVKEKMYSDVAASHWVYPYAVKATMYGITDGYDDGSFKPDNEVTVQEFVKMIVCAVGYGVYAENLGGYPNGYMAYASNISIIKDMVLKKDDVLTRRAAFNLLYNTLDVPLLVVDGYSVDGAGVVMPEYKVLDGEYFSSLRTGLSE